MSQPCSAPTQPIQRSRSIHRHRLARRLTPRLLRLLFPIVLLLPALGSAASYPVGNGSGCYPTLAAALVAAAADPAAEIRLSNDVVHQTGLQLINRSLTIRGGYASCSSSTPTPGAVSQLSSASSSALLIDGVAGTRRQLLIENLELVGSYNWNGIGDPPPGVTGGIIVRGPVDVVVRGGGFRNVHAQLPGGAVRMQSLATGVPELRLEDAVIEFASSSDRGGAISCQAGSLRLLRSRIAQSSARDGGGIHASGCSVHLDDSELHGNLGFRGGSIWLTGGVGTTTRLLAARSVLFDNTATNGGGGIRAEEAEVHLVNVKLYDNNGHEGSAIRGKASLVVMLGRACTLNQVQSPVNSGCSGVAANQIRNSGSAIHLVDASLAQLTQTLLAHNNTGFAEGALIEARDSILLLQNSVLTANNGLARLIDFRAAGQLLNLDHVSIHANTLRPGGVHIVVDDSGGPNFRLQNSIFEGGTRGFPLLAGVASPDVRCMVTDVALGSTLGERLSNDPGIGADGIHLRPDSLALDFCPAGLLGDLDGDDRPFDDPAASNPSPDRLADAGADERVTIVDAIHADGFEP